MPRRPRFAIPNVPIHVIQRGNNRTATFTDAEDCARFRTLLDSERARTGCAIHAYVLMTNHVHLLVSPRERTSISTMMQLLGRKYAQYFNARHRRTGTLWEGRFRSAVIDSERYFFVCSTYIEANPVRAKMVTRPDEYAWSSFRHNALGFGDDLVEPHPSYEQLGNSVEGRARAYAELYRAVRHDTDIAEIRRATARGLRLGSDSGV